MIYFVAFIIVYALKVLLKLNWWMTAGLLMYAVVMIPLHKKRWKKAKEAERRFMDVSLYLDTVLYAFVKEEKVELAIRDVYQTLPQGQMKELILQVSEYINMTYDEVEILDEALGMIEKEYSCKRLKDVHQFMTHVEYYGGEIEKPVNLLLADKRRWEKRIRIAIADRNKQMADVILSAAVSLLVCSAIVYLPVMNMDISKELVVQVAAFLVVVLNDCIVYRCQKYLAVDWIQMHLTEDEEYYVRKMESFCNYDEAKERKISYILGGTSLLFCVIAFGLGNDGMVVALLLLTLFLLNQHKIGRNLLRRNLVKEIKYAFPNWLLDLVLLLQSENVQVALMKSQQHVPGVFRKELAELTARLEVEPESSEPYHQFLQEFAIPEIHSAMGSLYSLSIGNSANADKQINELVEKNLELLDVTETILLKDSSSGMYVLFLLPVVTASFKLIVDMVFLMLAFLRVPMI